MFENRLEELRKEKGLPMKKVAEALGIPYTTYIHYEKNENEPNSDILLAIADFFECSVDYLLGRQESRTIAEAINVDSLSEQYDNIHPIKLKKFPLLGEIACGEPIWADEDRESCVMADMDINADFCLTAKGDSMINARIYDGDVVFIQKTEMVENGEIAAVIIGDEATLKRWYYDRENNKLVLMADNPKYTPLVYTNEELDTVHCLGKAVYFMSAL